MASPFHVLFYLRPSKPPHWGTVYCRITRSGRRLFDVSTSIKLEASGWNAATKRIDPNHPKSLIHNARLNNTASSIDKYVLYCELHENEVSGSRLYDIVAKGNFDAPTLLECFDRYLNAVEVQNSEGTYNTYLTRRTKLTQYLTETRQLKMMPEGFGPQEAERFRNWLLKTCGKTYAGKNLQTIKGFLGWAKREGFAKSNPLHDYRIRVPYEKELVYLTVGELSTLESAAFPTKRLARVADCFLFSCYTGLAYVDAKELRPVHFITQKGRVSIRVARRKTGISAFVPLVDKAVSIWERYGGKQLPVISNAGYNQLLKAVAAHAGIDKELTTHVARKTFAMHALNVHGYKSEAVAKMLGHASINQLKPYVFTEEDFVMREFDRVNGVATRTETVRVEVQATKTSEAVPRIV